MKLLLALMLLFVIGCDNQDKVSTSLSNLETTVKRAQVTFYRLGRNCGVLALFELQERELRTGKPYTLDEVYARADSIAQMREVKK